MSNVQVYLSLNLSIDESCKGFSRWSVYLLSSVISWIAGYLIILFWRFLWLCFFGDISAFLQKSLFGRVIFFDDQNQLPSKKYDFEWTLYIKKYASFISSPQTKIGKILMVLHYVLNVADVILYIYRVSYYL